MAILVTNAVQIARFANALYGIKLGSVTNAAVLQDVSAAGLTNAVNSYYTSSFGSLSNAAVATTILTNLGLADSAAAKAYVEGQLNAAGNAKGAAVLSMLNAFSNLTSDATFGAAATAWNEKIVAAQTYTASNAADVTTDYSAPVTGQTFTLTTSADNLSGTAGNDTFSGQVNHATTTQSTFTAGDTVTGGSGVDTLSLTVEGAVAGSAAQTLAAGTAVGVEIIKIRNLAGDEVLTVNADNFSGETTLVNDRSTVAVTFNNIGSADVTVIGDGSSSVATTTIDVGATSVTDAFTLNLQDGIKGAAAITVADTEADWTSATINSTGATNTVGTIGLTDQNSVTALTINASAGLTASGISGFKSTGATVTIAGATTTNVSIGTIDAAANTVDASGLTAAGLTATTNQATDSIIGGQGNDSITISAEKTTGTTALGAGVDKVITDADANINSAAEGALITGAETLEISSTISAADSSNVFASRSQDVSLVSGITKIGLSTYSLTDTDTADDDTTSSVSFTKLSAAVTDLTISGLDMVEDSSYDEDNTLTVSALRTTDTSADAITLTLGTTTAASGGLAETVSTTDDILLAVALENEETINIVSQGGDNGLSSLSAADATSLTVTGAKALTITAFTTAALTTVDASALTGAFKMGAAVNNLSSTVTGGSGNDTLIAGSGNDSLTGNAGEDNITAGDGNDYLSGGASNDTLNAEAGSDTVDGGDGVDAITGGSGMDNLSGGAGNDIFYVTENAEFVSSTGGLETVAGGDGTDTLSFANGATNAPVLSAASLLGLSGVEILQFLDVDANVSVTLTDAVYTANGNATLTIDADVMCSGALTVSASTLTAANAVKIDLDTTSLATAGSHNIVLGAGADTVIAELDDFATSTLTITGGAGTDTLQITDAGNASAFSGTQVSLDNGITGFEVITFTTATDDYNVKSVTENVASGATLTVSGSSLTTGRLKFDGSSETTTVGNFVILGGGSTDSLTGGNGNDSISGGSGADTLAGGSGIDTISGGDADDAINGGAGNDIITGDAGNDAITGDVGIDSLDGGAGNDTFTVGTTSGEFTGLTTAETVIGGAGNDTLSFAAGAFTVNNTDLNLSSIETIEFLATTANVSLTMTDAVMAANGNATVTIDADTITSGALTIAAGSLTSAYSLVVDLDTNSLAGDGSHSITLGAGNDTVIMELDDLTTNASLTVAGGSGSDTLQITDAGNASAAGSEITLDDGVTGFETITFTADDAYNIKTVSETVASGATLTVSGSSLTDILYFNGTLETDGYFNITSGGGADSIVGGAKADTISAGSGADTITGGTGADTLTGGAGADVFKYAAIADSSGTAVDSITDWTTAEDKLQVTLNYASQSAALDIKAVRLGTGAANLSTIQDGLTGKRGEYQYNVETSQLVINFNNDNLITASDYKIGLNAATTATATVGTADINFSITGGSSSDSIEAGGGADTITGGTGSDTITAGSGIDTINVDVGTDTITDLGLGGADILVVSASATAAATLGAAWTATSASDQDGTASIDVAGYALVLTSATGDYGWTITNSGAAASITGDALADTITGGTGADTILGAAGVDVIGGGNGNDSITGGSGADIITGGAGTDTYVYLATTDTGALQTGASSITAVTGYDVLTSVAAGETIDLDALLGANTISTSITTVTTAAATFAGASGAVKTYTGTYSASTGFTSLIVGSSTDLLLVIDLDGGDSATAYGAIVLTGVTSITSITAAGVITI